MKKAIEISVLRVSSNGKYIEFIINCPKDYFFTDFVINVYGGEDKYSLKNSLFLVPEGYVGEGTVEWPEDSGIIYWNKQYYSGQFKIEDIGVTIPEMFEVHLEAAHNDNFEDDEEQHPSDYIKEECIKPQEVITATAYISDVSKVYSCLMDDILSMGESLCDNSEVTDKLIRNYLILYAHQEAMHLRELPEARKYFTLLQNCFTKCGPVKTACNLCNGGTLIESRRYDTYKPSNCGCGK